MNEHRFAYPTVHEIRRAAKSPAPAMPTQRELVREHGRRDEQEGGRDRIARDPPEPGVRRGERRSRAAAEPPSRDGTRKQQQKSFHPHRTRIKPQIFRNLKDCPSCGCDSKWWSDGQGCKPAIGQMTKLQRFSDHHFGWPALARAILTACIFYSGRFWTGFGLVLKGLPDGSGALGA